jgi:hypothetical protein
MVDGSEYSQDTAMYIQSAGGEQILVPVRPDVPTQETEPEPKPDFIQDDQPIADIEMDFESHYNPPKNRWYYMKEFFAQAGGIIQAMRAREALSDSAMCSECSELDAHWRCDDCVGGKLMCRFCMRHSHFSNPFHRIEYWTGTHFRKAALWEVGVYLTLPHQNGGICTNLVWQKQMLEIFQKKKNKVVAPSTEEDQTGINYSESTKLAPDPEMEFTRDEAAMQFLDQLLAGHNPDEMMEEDDENDIVDMEADVQDMDAGTSGFTNYMAD